MGRGHLMGRAQNGSSQRIGWDWQGLQLLAPVKLDVVALVAQQHLASRIASLDWSNRHPPPLPLPPCSTRTRGA